MPYILATAGHVDHGKSSLVRALTGTDPDRLPEEKARGITIDLGFAQLALTVPDVAGGGAGSTTVSCGIVDVPGHEDFVKNMVAGVGAIDLALFVVAADDGWMPQTEEHLQILLHLGVTRAVVALTKIDLASTETEAVQAVRDRLAGTAFAHAPIVPTSVTTGRGLDKLATTLARVLAVTPAPTDFAKPRLWIDRSFALKGIGTIVTGTLFGGALATGSPVLIQPFDRPSRIRSCHTFGAGIDRVLPGTRVALNLTDLAVGGPGVSELAGVARGDVVGLPRSGTAIAVLDARLERSARHFGDATVAVRPLDDGIRVTFHLGTTAVSAAVHLLDQSRLLPGQRCLAQLRLDRPVLAFTGDPFLLRDASQQTTLAGGLVLDPAARRTRARAPARLALLSACALSPADPDPFLRLELAAPGLHRLDGLLRRSRFSTRTVLAGIGRLAAAGELSLVGQHAARADWWNEIRSTATTAIDAQHLARPDLSGMPLSELRAHLGWSGAPDPDPLPGLVDALTHAGFETDAQVIRRIGHCPTLPPPLQSAGHRIRQILDRLPLDPPARAILAPDATSRQALAFLLARRECVELGTEVILARKAYEQARDRIVGHLRRTGSATTGDLRETLGTTRRIMIPLLEHLDRAGVTVRDGDHRRLVPKK